MIFAYPRIYQRQHFGFSHADNEGAKVFGTDLLRAVLKYGSCEAVHVFADTYESFKDTEELGDWDALRSEFPLRPIEIKRVMDLPRLAQRSRYLFATTGMELQPLAQVRLSAGITFPLNSTLNALDWPFLLPLYLTAILLARPYDAIVVPSLAGERAVRQLADAAIDLLRTRVAGPIDCQLQIVHIPHGVDDTFFDQVDRPSARRLVGVKPEAKVALYLGRLNEHLKADLEPLLVAFAAAARTVPEALLVIAGHDIDGKYSKVLTRHADELGIRDKVLFILNFPHFIKPFIYAAADVFVSPVDNIQETFGLSVLEAMASGLPVVASDWSGYRDLVVNGKTGVLVPTTWDSSRADAVSKVSSVLKLKVRRQLLAEATAVDVKVLGDHLGALLSNHERRRAMGEAARTRAKSEFGWQTIIRRYEELWATQLEIARTTPTQPAVQLHDMNNLFGHYATNVVSASTTVKISDRGRAVLARGVEGLGDRARLLKVLRIVDRVNGDSVSVQQGAQAGGVRVAEIITCAKKGYLEFC